MSFSGNELHQIIFQFTLTRGGSKEIHHGDLLEWSKGLRWPSREMGVFERPEKCLQTNCRGNIK